MLANTKRKTPRPDAFATAVRRVVADLPEGCVVSYGDVAREAGFPGAARAVGRVLATSGAAGAGLPWWRVVAASGRLVPGHEVRHAAFLEAEDVPCRNGRVLRRPALR